jgi:hypothetical protein
MPTGYTAKLVESGQTFPEFVMGCARAFGACIEMRDDPADTPIPEEFKPSEYHTKGLRAAKSELTRLKNFSADKRRAYGEKQRAADISAHRGHVQKTEQQNARILSMMDQVRQWQPPTPAHEEMKKFMLQQLEISLGSTEYSERALAMAEARSPLEYFRVALKTAQNDIEYHEEELQKEVNRAKGNTDWIKQLRASLTVAR